MTTLQRALGYTRVSKVGERGDDLISPDLQKHAMTTWAARNNIVIVDWVEDLNESGRTSARRKIKSMIERVAAGEAEVVLVWKWSRWGRNTRDSLVNIALVEQAGGEVRCSDEDFDPKTTMGEYTRDQMLSLSTLQSNQISDGWKDTQAYRRRNHLPHSGQPRFGYTYSKRGGGADIGYLVNRTEADLVADAYERFVAGASMYSLAREWTAKGLRTRKGHAWNPTALGRMLDTGFAAGLIRERSVAGTARTNTRTLASFDLWREGKHEAIIDMELWDKYKTMRLENASKAPRTVRVTHPLSGLLICRECGTTMVSVYSGRHNKHTWSCRLVMTERKHAPVTLSNLRAESAVLTWLEERATGDQSGIEEEAQRHRQQAAAVTDLQALDTEVARLKAKKSRLADAWTDGDVDREDYDRQRAQIRVELERTTEAITHAKQAANPQYAGPLYAGLLDGWKVADAEQKNRLLLSVARGFIVRTGKYDGPIGTKLRVVSVWDA